MHPTPGWNRLNAICDHKETKHPLGHSSPPPRTGTPEQKFQCWRRLSACLAVAVTTEGMFRLLANAFRSCIII